MEACQFATTSWWASPLSPSSCLRKVEAPGKCKWGERIAPVRKPRNFWSTMGSSQAAWHLQISGPSSPGLRPAHSLSGHQLICDWPWAMTKAMKQCPLLKSSFLLLPGSIPLPPRPCAGMLERSEPRWSERRTLMSPTHLPLKVLLLGEEWQQ